MREHETLWFPWRATLQPAWMIRLTRSSPQEEWIVCVNARTGTILNKFDDLALAHEGRRRVFDPNAVTALGDYALLAGARHRVRRRPPVAYRDVALPGLDGTGTV